MAESVFDLSLLLMILRSKGILTRPEMEGIVSINTLTQSLIRDRVISRSDIKQSSERYKLILDFYHESLKKGMSGEEIRIRVRDFVRDNPLQFSNSRMELIA